MDTERKLELLREQLAGAPAASQNQDFNGWREKTSSVLRLVLGPGHVLTQRFEQIDYSPTMFVMGDTVAFDNARRAGVSRAIALIETAIFEVQNAESDEDLAASLVDVELWSKIDHLVIGERWDQVVSQAVIFFEHSVRTRAGLPNSVIGVDVMKEAFRPGGGALELATGENPSETEGWHLLAKALTMAVRNVAGHRIEDRADGRTYAFGVLGTRTGRKKRGSKISQWARTGPGEHPAGPRT